jgi:hypothetical protein
MNDPTDFQERPKPEPQPLPRKVSRGVARRAQVDTETVRALLLVHGGGAVALLTVLRSFLESEKYSQLARPILSGIIIFMVGLVCTIVHNQLRRQCSLVYDHYWQYNTQPPPGIILGWHLKKHPTICFFGWAFMWLSIISIVCVAFVVGVSGILAIADIERAALQ